MDEQVRISISDGKGNKIGSALFEVQERIENEYVGSIATLQQISPSQREYAGDYIEQHGSDFSDYPAPLIGLKIWLPPDRNGTWQVTAQTDYGQVSGNITANRSGNPPALYMPQSNQNPFLWPPASYEVGGVETGSYPLKAGEAIQLQALGLPRNHLLPVALYRAGRLSTAANLPSDAQGRMGINLTIDPTDPPGQYHLVVVLDAETEGARDVGPFLGIYADTCPGSPPSALFIGDIVELHWDNLIPNNLRSQPGLKGKVTGKLDLGQTAEVLDGFVCADKMVWWKVRTSAGQEGWTSEGQGEKIFLTVIQ
jgi:hypothetical protein